MTLPIGRPFARKLALFDFSQIPPSAIVRQPVRLWQIFLGNPSPYRGTADAIPFCEMVVADVSLHVCNPVLTRLPDATLWG